MITTNLSSSEEKNGVTCKPAAAPRYGYRILGKDIAVSNDTELTGLNNNDLIIGKPGAGKSGSILYPNLKILNDSSLVLTDSKRQFSKKFKKEFEERGYKVYVLDFVDPKKSCGYNPLDYIRRDRDGSIFTEDIQTIANILMPLRTLKDPIWEQCGQLLIEFLIAYCLEALPDKFHNMMTVCDLYHDFINPAKRTIMDDWILEHPDSHAAVIYGELKTNFVAEKMYASIIGFMNVAFRPFNLHSSSYIFDSKRNFDIRSLGKRKTALFINVSDVDSVFDNVVILFLRQALTVLTRLADKNKDQRLKMPVRFMMDDFASTPIIPEFHKIMPIVRSRDIYITIFIQSLRQLHSLYGDDNATTIVDCCDHIVLFNTNNKETAEMVATRAFKTPESIYTLDTSKEYYIESGKKAEIVDKIKPYSYD